MFVVHNYPHMSTKIITTGTIARGSTPSKSAKNVTPMSSGVSCIVLTIWGAPGCHGAPPCQGVTCKASDSRNRVALHISKRIKSGFINAVKIYFVTR